MCSRWLYDERRDTLAVESSVWQTVHGPQSHTQPHMRIIKSLWALLEVLEEEKKYCIVTAGFLISWATRRRFAQDNFRYTLHRAAMMATQVALAQSYIPKKQRDARVYSTLCILVASTLIF